MKFQSPNSKLQIINDDLMNKRSWGEIELGAQIAVIANPKGEAISIHD